MKKDDMMFQTLHLRSGLNTLYNFTVTRDKKHLFTLQECFTSEDGILEPSIDIKIYEKNFDQFKNAFDWQEKQNIDLKKLSLKYCTSNIRKFQKPLAMHYLKSINTIGLLESDKTVTLIPLETPLDKVNFKDPHLDSFFYSRGVCKTLASSLPKTPEN